MGKSRSIPPANVDITYETAASLMDIMCAAYVHLEEERPEVYAEVMQQTKRFFEFLSAYLQQFS